MNMLRPAEPNGYWNAPTYCIKVRGLKYLWGSAGLSRDVKFEKAFVLHVANDLAGQPVKIGTQTASGAKTELGTVEAGEFLSVSVNNISGVYADCGSESLVHCLIC